MNIFRFNSAVHQAVSRASLPDSINAAEKLSPVQFNDGQLSNISLFVFYFHFLSLQECVCFKILHKLGHSAGTSLERQRLHPEQFEWKRVLQEQCLRDGRLPPIAFEYYRILPNPLAHFRILLNASEYFRTVSNTSPLGFSLKFSRRAIGRN